MDAKKLKLLWKKTWHFIWEEDSIASWVVNVILAFVIIKFIVFPGLGFLLNTTHPIVAVVSNSMEHDGGFDKWWDSGAVCDFGSCTQGEFYAEYDTSKDEFKEYRFKNGFNKGDIMVLYGVRPKDLKEGDVLVFQSSRPDPIIHRIVKIRQDEGKFYYQTKGDHNPTSIKGGIMNCLAETNIPLEATIGYQKHERASVAVMRVPFLGYIKIWFVGIVKWIAGLI